ncbi:response regulator transcription factor [Prosthecomicrobium sp. N25]|uniref:response regulator transcription factor n=1 Tax=Prosthecomicrobium sp. N25 TaxID=3129254 RepID=UPI0030779097
MQGAERRTRIAIVDDDPALRDGIADMVRTEGYEPLPCGSAAALLGLMDGPHEPDLILLDLRLPDRDGLAVAGAIRSASSVPIIMLTGRGGDLDRILGLEIGADDYVVKPFNSRELLARIKAVLRRLGRERLPERPTPALRNGYRFAGHELDLDRRTLTAPTGTPVALTVAEFDLLAALLKGHGRVLTRDQILEMSHRGNDDVFDRTVDVLVLRLRRKIEPNPASPRFIRTERGLGYVFDGDVEVFRARE